MKRACRIVGVNLAVLLTGVIILELAFGSWFNPEHLNRLNLIRGSTILYDVRPFYATPMRRVVYRRDEFALRGVYPSPDRIDILTMGGSTTDQRLITEGETWQDVLAKEFAARGQTVSVVNAGVDGQSTYGHIKDFDWWFPFIPHFHVRYVLFYVGINDLYTGADPGKEDLVHGGSIRWLIQENSAFYYLYRTLYGIHEASAAEVNHHKVDFSRVRWTGRPLVGDHEHLMQFLLQAYRERLRILGEKVRRLGGVPICVTQTEHSYKRVGEQIVGDEGTHVFAGARVNGADTYHMMALLNDATLEECRRMGGLGIDLARELVFEDDDFYDFSHNTPRGAAKIGRYLYQRLAASPEFVISRRRS